MHASVALASIGWTSMRPIPNRFYPLTSYNQVCVERMRLGHPGESDEHKFFRWLFFCSETMNRNLRNKLTEWAWQLGYESARVLDPAMAAHNFLQVSRVSRMLIHTNYGVSVVTNYLNGYRDKLEEEV